MLLLRSCFVVVVVFNFFPHTLYQAQYYWQTNCKAFLHSHFNLDLKKAILFGCNQILERWQFVKKRSVGSMHLHCKYISYAFVFFCFLLVFKEGEQDVCVQNNLVCIFNI